MLLPHLTPHPPRAEPGVSHRLAEAATALATAIAERGPAAPLLLEASDLCQASVRLARAAADDAPSAAFALMDGCRHLVEALGSDVAAGATAMEGELLAALDEMHLGLLAIIENAPISAHRPLREVVGWLCAVLGVTQREFAAGVGVPERTLQRWLLDEAAIPVPQRARLELIIRALNEIRFVFRGGLAMSWLTRPNLGAGGRAPLELVEQPAVFLQLAAASRF
ncbi:MAG: hypothetical protein ABR541_07925 [Candidatus Dormibacteria bacterium]